MTKTRDIPKEPKMRRPDPYQDRARLLATAAGLDPDAKIDRPGARPLPTWCTFLDAARDVALAQARQEPVAPIAPQSAQFANSPLKVFGQHDQKTIDQMRACMEVGNCVAGVICADGHLGYAQPVGGVIAYEKQISISGVGFDIGCGNMAVRLDTRYDDIRENAATILQDIRKVISFGIGRTNAEGAEHALFDDGDAWRASDMEAYRQKAVGQLGTVGSGNHYVDLLTDQAGFVWIGVHFGSRGLGHTSATRYLKAAGGKDGMNVAPAVVDEDSEIGRRYIAAMQLAGRYSYAGREWVVDRVRQIIGGEITDRVHNHHNYAWREKHVVGGVERDLWVVRKGATPAFPGQRGFVGGSMGDDCVILEGVDSEEAKAALYSTVHGAGRLFGRMQAKRTFTQAQMDAWLQERGVLLAGGDLDESPMAYRRLPEVLAAHGGSVKVLHTLRPFAVAMAGSAEFDPWKD
ncbi:MAG TPA: RtcB family protein [Aliidongia sp.]|uniref:RtcB family protein n=1 Tax=Aliidongia sp. TaxID=1914230 RepID=UPI002DDD0C24|nr:RtcB family protein [Aliidongia sp.]HEV2675855.1 RtcB family protein [Aliidongia sp.]